MSETEKFIEWVLTVKPGSPMPGYAVKMLRKAILKRVKEGVPIDKSFGLCGMRISYRWKLKVRNSHLKNAYAEFIRANPERGVNDFSKEIRRFESIGWIRYRENDDPPQGLSRMHSELFLALKTGMRTPGEKMLREIC